MTETMLELDRIRLDGDTQPRASLCADTVDDYCQEIERGADLPPLIVFYDGSHYWLASGFHRFHAMRRRGQSHAACKVKNGTVKDARLFAASTNVKHGLRRTVADKRRAVHMVIEDESAKTWSDEQIAEHVGVSIPLVRSIRMSSKWIPSPTLFEVKDPLECPPEPDYAHAPAAVKIDHGVSLTKGEVGDEDREELRAKAAKLVRKLLACADALGTSIEELLATYR